MKSTLPTQKLNEISVLIDNALGLHFPKEKWHDLERNLKVLSKDLNFSSIESCMEWLSQAPLNQSQIESIASQFTVGETYFFRDNAYFDILETQILPPLIETRRHSEKQLRFWSAGCSSGEEAYSLAILLSKLIPDIKYWNITLIASDINVKAQHKLTRGIYGEWSFRSVDPKIKEEYFKKLDKHKYEIIPEIKKMVTPLFLNLATDPYPSLLNNTNAMDVIFCRNVLMYFSENTIHKVIDHLSRSLTQQGYLFVGASENHLVKDKYLEHRLAKGISFFQKNLYFQLEAQASTHPVFTSDPLENPDVDTLPQDMRVKDLENLTNDTVSAEDDKLSPQKEVAAPIPSSKSQDFESLARSLANQGELHSALSLVEQGLTQDKFNKNLYYLKSLVLWELGELPEALVELRKTIYLDPNFILPYFSLGNILRQQGDLKQAKNAFLTVAHLLKGSNPQDILPGSEGMTVARLEQVIKALQN